jgi:hypothetical protein
MPLAGDLTRTITLKARPACLREEESIAIRALQTGDSPPASDDPVWHNLAAMRLVWLDPCVRPAGIHLTELGRHYPAPR